MEANLEAQEHQPLLPSEHDENSSKLKVDHDSTHISFPPEAMSFTFNEGERPYRDSIFAFLFFATILLTYGLGMVSFTRADFNLDSKLQRSKFNPNTNQCEQGRPNSEDTDVEDSVFLKLMAIVPLSALVMTFPVGLLLLWLLHHYTRGFVMVTAPLMCLFPLGICVSWLTWCYGINDTCATVLPMWSQIFYVVYLPGLTALLAYRLWKNFKNSKISFEISIQLIQMATHALKEHFWLLIVNPALFLGSMVLVNGPILTFIWYAFNNGMIVPNFDVVNDPSKGCDQSTGYPCCQEERSGWVTAYVALAFFTVFWVLMVTIHLQILVVSGTVSNWYFAPTGSPTTGNIKRSLRNAFGPSFGTACNLGTIVTTLVVAILGLLRKASNRVLNSSRQGMIFSILRGCFSWLSRIPECDPRFASNFAAISGDSFWESSKKANSLLQRNSLSTTRMYSLLVHYVFSGMIFIYGMLQSFVVYRVLEYFTNIGFVMKFTIAMFCFPVTMIGLGQFHQAISSAMDTVYMCYAMEKDVGEISKPEVCHAFMLLPPENGAPEDKLSAPTFC